MNADNNFASEEVANGSASESAKMATSEEGRSSRRRKIVLFMGYLGEKYQGMQRNPGTTTIEGALMEALVKAGCIDLELENDFAKLKWSRAARTDKGVSAAGQVVSAMLHGEVDGQLQDSVIDKINEHIDDDIKVYGWLRPTASFGAKNDCVRRRYEYIMPESALGKLEGTDGTDSAGDRDPRISRFNDILAKYTICDRKTSVRDRESENGFGIAGPGTRVPTNFTTLRTTWMGKTQLRSATFSTARVASRSSSTVTSL